MGKTRPEAFSDGVIAIINMVRELKVPHGAGIDALLPLWPVFMRYVHSFTSASTELAPVRKLPIVVQSIHTVLRLVLAAYVSPTSLVPDRKPTWM